MGRLRGTDHVHTPSRNGRLTIDAHLDLGWNALGWDRDLTLSLDELRRSERHMTDHRARGNATVTIDELRRGCVAVCFATVLARAVPPGGALPPSVDLASPAQQVGIPADGSPRSALDYRTPEHAYAAAQGQLAYYRQLEEQGYVCLIRTGSQLDAHWQRWTSEDANPGELPIGLVLTMEGADPIVTPQQSRRWYEQGLRAVGPVHYGRSAYAVGTGFEGAMSEAGHALLREFAQLNMILDVTHLSDESFTDALEHFDGRVIASHHNCRALVPRQRQLTDDQIRRLIERDAVIGLALDAWMLHSECQAGRGMGDIVDLEAAADHIDHICSLAGTSRHSGIGSDLDGGFGREQTPSGLDTIADVQKLDAILERRGYSSEDRDRIFHGNWLRLLRETLPP